MVVQQQEARLKTSAPQLQLQAEDASTLPLLAVDSDDLQELLAELLDNAGEALPQGGTARVQAASVDIDAELGRQLLGSPTPGRYVQVTVEDNGPGFSPAAQTRLFSDIFFSTKPRCRGLGLLTAYGILRRCRGGLRVVPSQPTGGTRVDVFIPVAELPPPGAVADLPNRTILVVSDSAVTRESMRHVLESAGCQVSLAPGAHSALVLHQAQRGRGLFALVLVDVQLEDMSGFDLAQRLLDRDSSANFLFVQMQRGFPQAVHDERLRSFPFLAQPFEPLALTNAVRSSLQRGFRKGP
jgi:CheY-like chemotaxis protein